MFKGPDGLKHFIVELKHIITPTKLLGRPGVVSECHNIYICFTPVCLLLNIHMYIYALLVLYSCFTSLDICNCCNPPLVTYIHLYSCFTPTLLVLFLVCVCVCVCACVCVSVPAYLPSTRASRVCGGK